MSVDNSDDLLFTEINGKPYCSDDGMNWSEIKMADNENITITNEQLDSIVSGAVAKALEGQAKNNETTVADEARKNLDAQEAAKKERADLEAAIKFNLFVDGFVKEKKNVLPKEADAILKTVNGKSYSGEKEKADAVRAALIDSFIAQQANIDILTPSLKNEVENYKALTESEKNKQSAKFWQIVEVGVNNKTLANKAAQLALSNGVSENNDEFEQRFLALGDKFKKGK